MKSLLISLPVFLSFCVFVSSTLAQSDRDLGIQAYRDNNYQKAVEILQKYLATNEKDGTAWMYLGGAYSHLNDEKNARKALLKGSGKVSKDQLVLTYDKPYEMVSMPRPRLSDATLAASRGANVRVIIELRSDGKLGFIFPLPNFDRAFERDAIEAVKGIRFKPAIKDGKPVTVIITREYSFWTS